MRSVAAFSSCGALWIGDMCWPPPHLCSGFMPLYSVALNRCVQQEYREYRKRGRLALLNICLSDLSLLSVICTSNFLLALLLYRSQPFRSDLSSFEFKSGSSQKSDYRLGLFLSCWISQRPLAGNCCSFCTV
jgi:hypothetical protein